MSDLAVKHVLESLPMVLFVIWGLLAVFRDRFAYRRKDRQ
jgi:hypothetical protein